MILVGFGWCDGCCGCGCFLYGDSSAVVVVDRRLGDHEILIRLLGLLERQATRGVHENGVDLSELSTASTCDSFL